MPGARRLRFLLCGCAVLIALSPAVARDYPGKPLKSTTGAVFRSLAFPGWGQFYTECYWRAGIYAAAEGSFIASVWWNHNQMKEFKRQHDTRLERFYRNQRNRMVWWLAGTMLLSMGDAYVDAHLYGLDWSPEISSDHRGVNGGLAVAIRF